jgi:glycosyltransferase involved in cell wall biosynthesis
MTQPRVTVGLPVYNDPAGLRRTVPTVLGQTWQGPIRLLIIDDGSTDDTPEVLAQLAATYPQIEVVRHPYNQGRPYARNTIIERAGDDYLAWIDAGDLWHPRKLELQLATLLAAEQRDPDTPLLCTGPLRWVFTDQDENRIKIPDVSGDQLRNALIGRLFPYLPAIVGRAAHFRDAGGFDGRLMRRQDYDFLVRFLAAGGRVVSSPPHVPIYTYLKSDVGASPEVVALANEIIRAKHRPYYRRYGRRLAREVRHNQHRLVARFYRNNRQAVPSRIYQTRETLSDPELLDPTRRAVSRVLVPTSQAVGHALSAPYRGTAWLMRYLYTSVFRVVLLVLRRPPVIAFVRWLRLRHLLTTTSAGRAAYRRIKSKVKPAASRPAPPPDLPPDPEPPPIPRLSDTMDAATAAGARLWLDLEEAYRERGLLHSAEIALRRGLAAHPDDPELTIRLIELLPLRKKSAECIDLWASLNSAENRFVQATTYTRVLRAFRALNRHADALAVAEEGVRRWPRELSADPEVHRSRAAFVNWKRAIAPAATPDGRGDPESVGAVTDLGFLHGSDAALQGWVVPTGDDSPMVSLKVNGQPVAITSAARLPSSDGRFHFSLSCQDLLAYVGDGDIISVESAGGPLAVDGDHVRVQVASGYRSRFPELKAKLGSGYVFTKFGAFRLGNTAERKERTLDVYQQVSAILDEAYGYPAFPFYGNLLGAVREHDFIDHDVGGFDMGYVSCHRRPDEVRAEFLDICRLLRDRGYRLKVEPWSAYVRPTHDSAAFVDLNYAWFNEAGEFNLSYGWRCPPVTDGAAVLAPRESLLANHLVRVPGNAEQVLEQIYGPSWAVPDQGFPLDVGLKRDPAYLLTVDEMTSLEQSDPDRVEALIDHHPALSGELATR